MKTLFTVLLALSTFGAIAQNNDFKNDAVNNLTPEIKGGTQTSTDALQASLYELTDQYLAVHQMHWNVRGPEFYSLHDLLGELYEDLAGSIDMIAERKLALGQAADGRPDAVAKNANLEAIPADYVKDSQVIDLLSKRYKTITDRLGDRIEETGKTDVATQDALIGVRRMIDLHLYKLRSFTYK
ncbi:MAG: DNA starvation/stationary phase protection protein [Leeuwenhoekiella sp.]